MNFTWNTPKATDAADAYLDWFDHVYQPGTDGAYGYEITFVKIKPTGNPASFATTLSWIADKIDTATANSDFLMDNVERERLSALLASPPSGDDALDLFLHKKRSATDFATKYAMEFDVIPHGAAQPTYPLTPKPASPMPAPIVAIVDDAIGYLNARFCSDATGLRKTRLNRIWLHSSSCQITEFSD